MIKYAYICEKSKEHKLQYNILLVGATGAGKSSTINALYEFYSGKHEAIPTQYAKVGDSVAPETMEITKYPMFPYLNIWDSPGLGDGKANDEMHHRKIAAFLKNTDIDLIMVIVDGSGRDLGTIYKVLNKIILPNYCINILPNYYIKENVVILVNQADMAMKGRNWNKEYNIPNAELQNFLNNQAISVQQRIKEATGLSVNSIIHYSAEKNFNLNEIASLIYNKMLIKIDILQKRKVEQERKEKEKQEKLRQKEIVHLETEQAEAFSFIVGCIILVIPFLSFYFNVNFHGFGYFLIVVYLVFLGWFDNSGLNIFETGVLFGTFLGLLFMLPVMTLVISIVSFIFGFDFGLGAGFHFYKIGYFLLWCVIVILLGLIAMNIIYMIYLSYQIKDKKAAVND